MFHILVVEDDAKLRSLFCTVLNRSGYLTVPASGGREALELLDSEYIDLIISDIMMPGMGAVPEQCEKCETPVRVGETVL